MKLCIPAILGPAAACCACNIKTGLKDAADSGLIRRLFSCLPAFQLALSSARCHVFFQRHIRSGASAASNNRGVSRGLLSVVATRESRPLLRVVGRSQLCCCDVRQRRPAGVCELATGYIRLATIQ